MDVAVAMGFNYGVIPVGDTGVITINVSQTQPTSGFYITQSKPADSSGKDPAAEAVYFSASFALQTPSTVPEPSSIALIGSTAVGLTLKRFLRRGKK
jgi:hypothetical protein